jgi:hypothetical protein
LEQSVSDTFGSAFTTNTNTQFLGGGQVGVNYQFWGGVVIGAEAIRLASQHDKYNHRDKSHCWRRSIIDG